MVQYYRLDKKVVVDTLQTIPQTEWAKKNILPYTLVIENIFTDTTTPAHTEGIVIGTNLVTEYKYNNINQTELQYNIDLKVAEMSSMAKSIMEQGYTCSNGIKVDCRKIDKINWFALLTNCQANSAYTSPIRDYDNVTHSNLTNAELVTMLTEIETYYVTMMEKEWTNKDAVKALTTVSAVQAYTWS